MTTSADDLADLFPVPEQLITIDFETYYADDYTLSKMTTSDYIRDPRFETIGVGVKVNDGPSRWMEAVEFAEWADTVNWSKVAVLAHHAHFDGLILSYHFGIIPGMWLDTLSMARALHGTEVGGSLAKLAERYGLGEKGHEVLNAKNKRRHDFTPEDWARYGEYCKNDVELTYALLHQKPFQAFPKAELWLVDTIIRMFTEPSLVLDQPLLHGFLGEERRRKAALLTRVAELHGKYVSEAAEEEELLEATKGILMSNEKFAAMLQSLGVEPPMKISPRTGEPAFAFAKTDPGMEALLEHEDDEVRWLAEARVGVKSTINESRAERFLKAGRGGRLVPVYLKYAAAHTGRLGGGDRMNFQNMNRVKGRCRLAPGHGGAHAN